MIAVATEAGAALRWARAMRELGAAVILDTETTDLDGYVVEVAVLDAATGQVLLDTLVNPGCPVQPGARWVHGISDTELSGAPPLAQVWSQLRQVTAGRTVLAYNASFDQDVVLRHAQRDGLDPAHCGSLAGRCIGREAGCRRARGLYVDHADELAHPGRSPATAGF